MIVKAAQAVRTCGHERAFLYLASWDSCWSPGWGVVARLSALIADQHPTINYACMQDLDIDLIWLLQKSQVLEALRSQAVMGNAAFE